jgi:hypothetical protein
VPPLRIAVKELLDREKHPFYANAEAEFFLARRDGQVVGRMAAILDKAHNRFHEENAGFFGFFESIDDQAVAKALLDRAWQWVCAARRQVPARAGESIHQLRVRHADRRLRFRPDGDDDLQSALLSGTDGSEAGLRKPRICTPTQQRQHVDMKKIERVADKALAATG